MPLQVFGETVASEPAEQWRAQAHRPHRHMITVAEELHLVTRLDPELTTELLRDHHLTLRAHPRSHTDEYNRPIDARVRRPSTADLIVHSGPIFGAGALVEAEAGRMNDLLLARASISGGVFTATDALACGYDRQSLSRLARTGAVVRIGRGAYAGRESYAAAAPEERHRLATRAVVQRFVGRVAASHYSALTLLRLPVWKARLDRVHVARTDAGRGRRSTGVQIHKGQGQGAYGAVDGMACVRPALAVLGTAMLCGVEAGLIAADAALAATLVTRQELDSWLARLVRHPSLRDARATIDMADARSESPGESRTRLLLRSLALGNAVPQVEIHDADGRLVGRVDFLYERQRTIVEFDGLVKYGDVDGRQALVAEKRREDRLRDLGYQVVRVTWHELERPGILQRRIQAAFARAAATPVMR